MTSHDQLPEKINSTIAILGASRGLGAKLVEIYTSDLGRPLRLARDLRMDLKIDFSKENQWPSVLEYLQEKKVKRVFYCAGGGPYGSYTLSSSKWEAQEWSHRVTFLFPAFLIHKSLSSLQQMIFIGSSIAESTADPGAAMYSASKHALRGLITTVQAELKTSGSFQQDLRLFSPGYMDTALLPRNAWPRLSPPEGMVIHDPVLVAQQFREFAEDQSKICQNLIQEPFQRLPRPIR